MIGILHQILLACWEILLEASPFILFGFLVAGLVKALLPEGAVLRHLGGGGAAPVVKAALFGIPLPLCSCGVIPAAIGLKKEGASKGATSSFLISTPETGVDSVAITWALLDPLMTLFRPIAAFLTAVTAGLLENFLPDGGRQASAAPEPACTGAACGCSGEEQAPALRDPLRKRLADGLSYAFGELLADIGKWLLIGIGVAGLISALIPESFIESHLSGGLPAMLIMLVAGIPLYVCASASTPIAAALVLKGLSPGAALVFLLAGPATNSATITAVAKYLGRRSLFIYLGAIAGCSLLLGGVLDLIYAAWDLDLQAAIGHGADALPAWFSLGATFLLLFLLARHFLSRRQGSCAGKDCGCD